MNAIIDKFIDGIRILDRRIDHSVDRVKKRFLKTILYMLFLGFSITFTTVGVILFFSRFFSLDIVLICAGALFLYIALMFHIIR